MLHVGAHGNRECGAVGSENERIAVTEAAEHTDALGQFHVVVRLEGSLFDGNAAGKVSGNDLDRGFTGFSII